MTAQRSLVAVALLAAIPVVIAAATAGAAAGPKVCDSASALTLVGIDTRSGRTLWSLPARGTGGTSATGAAGATGWLVELAAGDDAARLWPDRKERGSQTTGGRFGGSVGPGPILAATSCGSACIQPVAWRAGSWQPLGEPLTLPAAATVSTTYDEAGRPWVVAHGQGDREGWAKAWAFRFDGAEWVSRGTLAVTAAGSPPALPAPGVKDAVVSGTGLFSAAGKPMQWAKGLPSVPADRRGEVVPMGGDAAAYLAGDGAVYLSADRGATWRRSTWAPWGRGTTGIWRQGSDYSVDVPVGDRRGALRMAWFDRRDPAAETMILTRLAPGGEGEVLAQGPASLGTKSGEVLPVSHVVAPTARSLLLLSGCAATAEGSGLVLRTLDEKGLSAPRLVPIEAARGGR